MKEYKRPLPPDCIAVASPGGEAGPHNWQKKFQRLVDSGTLPVGSVSMVDVAHDDWCEIYNQMPCNCDPALVNRLTGETY